MTLTKIRNWTIQLKMNVRGILETSSGSYIFQERSKRQIITEFIIIITPFNKFSFINILEWILIVNQQHLNDVLSKVNKAIGLLHMFQAVLPRQSLRHIKDLLEPILTTGILFMTKVYNGPFHQKMESVQYNAALAITGAVRSTSGEKLQAQNHSAKDDSSAAFSKYIK